MPLKRVTTWTSISERAWAMLRTFELVLLGPEAVADQIRRPLLGVVPLVPPDGTPIHLRNSGGN